MKTRHINKNPDPENALFALDYCDPVKRRKKHIDPVQQAADQAKLDRTRAFGGLVPERSPLLDSLCRKLGNKPKSWAEGYTYEVPEVRSSAQPSVDQPRVDPAN